MLISFVFPGILKLLGRHAHAADLDGVGVLGADDAVGQDLVGRADDDGVVILVHHGCAAQLFPADVLLAVVAVLETVSLRFLLAAEEHLAHDKVLPVLQARGRVPGVTFPQDFLLFELSVFF